MGRLSGFKYREVARRLRVFGFAFDRQGPGSHEVWRDVKTGRKVTLPHHSPDMAEGTLRAILRRLSLFPRSLTASEKTARFFAPHGSCPRGVTLGRDA